MGMYSDTLKRFKGVSSLPENREFLEKWESVYKNKYVSPKHYHSWEVFSKLCFVLSNPATLKLSHEHKFDERFNYVMGACCIAVNLSAPGLFLSPELHLSLEDTELPEISETPKLPFPAFCVLFTAGNRIHSDKDTILALIVSETIKPIPNSSDGAVVSLVLERDTGEFRYNCSNLHWAEPKKDNGATKLVKHLILLYNNKRELFTEEKVVPVRGTGFGKASKQSDPEPTRFIGKFFENKVRYVGRSRGDKGGAKKRPHWRRGHWHRVCHGKGRKERKYQWFQPVYVCPSEKDSSETS